MTSFPAGGLAVVLGATGAIGGAVLAALEDEPAFARTIGLARMGTPPLDLLSEASIAGAADYIVRLGLAPRLIIDATGFLHGDGMAPEKSWRDLDPTHLARAFAINATGPALLMKHLLPLLPPRGKSVFISLSARVGSISDNHLGGWYAYRASKAALNQFVRTAAIELKRRRSEAICVALHPGTVATPLSAPFAKSGLDVRPPNVAAAELLAVIDGLRPDQSGGFFDYRGEALAW